MKVENRAGEYDRLEVRCPHHHSYVKRCGRKRNLGVRWATAAVELGDVEAYAFLGAWLRAASDFGSADEHCRYTPSADKVRAYARDFLRPATGSAQPPV